MEKKPLTELEIATLMSLFYATNGSIHSYVPKQAVQSRFKSHVRGFVQKELEKLVKRGCAFKKPRGRKTTYGITKKGINALKQKELI